MLQMPKQLEINNYTTTAPRIRQPSASSPITRTLADEQHFRRASCMTTNAYAKSGIRQSAMALIKITGLHPNLAAGFHHVSRAGPSGQLRHLETITPAPDNAEILRQTGKHDGHMITGCLCCNNDSVADSLGHFIFECSLTIKESRH